MLTLRKIAAVFIWFVLLEAIALFMVWKDFATWGFWTPFLGTHVVFLVLAVFGGLFYFSVRLWDGE